MSHYRSEYRAAVRQALAAHERFADCEVLPVWPGTVDAASLPVIGVLTPQEKSTPDTQTSTTRGTMMQVALRRLGLDDVEDRLDADSEVIEAIVLATLRSNSRGCVLEDTSIVSHSESRQNVGTLVMSFRITSWRLVATLP